MLLSATLSTVLLSSLVSPPVALLGMTTEAETDAQAQTITTEYWAGHQVTFGTREVPVLGTLETRLDNYVLARVRRQGDTIQIDQRACKVNYGDVGGVKVYIDANALPDSRIVFERVEGTPHYSMSGTVNWGEEDIDEDGNPGMRVYVDAPVCSGNLHVTNKTTTSARAFSDDGGPLYGEVTISVRQKILGAEGRCLSALSKDSFERSKGSFRYVKVKPNDTCKTLLAAGWPVKTK
jgi:hypothetical protein